MSENSVGAIPVLRGCGSREPGGIYLECGLSLYGRPVEDFLSDPPILLSKEWNLSPLGVSFIERDGVWHVIDWVGYQHYPNVADFVEEVSRFGLSRRISQKEDFSKLSSKSKILLVHSRAFIDPEQICQYKQWNCIKKYSHHAPEILLQEPEESKRMCAGLWWYDIEDVDVSKLPKESDAVLGGVEKKPREFDAVLGGLPLETLEDRLIIRKMPSFQYQCYRRPRSVKPKYQPAIFASFPVSRIAVITGSERTQSNLDKASKSNILVKEVEF
jgi:hypothetical protein